ncbi:DMT family transporter [Candidatus Peregrinibacteria bacterium]|nr:MAG: DMT family transporter [Candidatus Peregrinibacteria bacterium]
MLLWSFFPIISILASSTVPPLFTLAISTLIATLFFGAMMSYQKTWHELKTPSTFKNVLLGTFFIVSFYCLVFIGLKQTTAGNASIILLMEVFFSIVILELWGKERMSRSHQSGALLMVAGAILVLFKGQNHLNPGDLIILAATALPPMGNYYFQQARKQIGSVTILSIRSVLGGIAVLALAMLIEPLPTLANLSTSLPFLLINGFLLFGLSKILWLEAIHRIPITHAISLNSMTPAFTLIFAFLILGENPTLWQIIGLLPILFGVRLLTKADS